MLKFSGYPYLIRGQPEKIWLGVGWRRPGLQERVTKPHTLEDQTDVAAAFRAGPRGDRTQHTSRA